MNGKNAICTKSQTNSVSSTMQCAVTVLMDMAEMVSCAALVTMMKETGDGVQAVASWLVRFKTVLVASMESLFHRTCPQAETKSCSHGTIVLS